jgi:hypothetical protein
MKLGNGFTVFLTCYCYFLGLNFLSTFTGDYFLGFIIALWTRRNISYIASRSSLNASSLLSIIILSSCYPYNSSSRAARLHGFFVLLQHPDSCPLPCIGDDYIFLLSSAVTAVPTFYPKIPADNIFSYCNVRDIMGSAVVPCAE